MHELLGSISGWRPVECRAQRQGWSRVDEAGGADLRILGIEQILDGGIELEAGTGGELTAEVENEVRLGADIGLADRRVGTQGTGIQRDQIPGSEHCVDAGLHRVFGDTGHFLALTSLIMVGKTHRPPIALDRNPCVDRSPDPRESALEVRISEFAGEMRVGPGAGKGQRGDTEETYPCPPVEPLSDAGAGAGDLQRHRVDNALVGDIRPERRELDVGAVVVPVDAYLACPGLKRGSAPVFDDSGGPAEAMTQGGEQRGILSEQIPDAGLRADDGA